MLHEPTHTLSLGVLYTMLGFIVLIATMLSSNNMRWLFTIPGAMLYALGWGFFGSLKPKPAHNWRAAIALDLAGFLLLLTAVAELGFDAYAAWMLFFAGTMYMSIFSFELSAHHHHTLSASSPANPQDV